MRRRQFLGYTGLTASVILAGGFLDTSDIFAARRTGSPRGDIGESGRLRMNGGRCHDHRFLNGEPTAAFEREVFGI